jgi:hypothetical protein
VDFEKEHKITNQLASPCPSARNESKTTERVINLILDSFAKIVDKFQFAYGDKTVTETTCIYMPVWELLER